MSYYRNNHMPEYAAYGGVPSDEAYGRANGGVPYEEAYGKKKDVNNERENRPTLREQLEANWRKIKEREEERSAEQEEEDEESVAEEEESLAEDEETAADNQSATVADEDFVFGQPSGSSSSDNIDKINDFVKHYNEMHQSTSPQLYGGTMTPASQSVSDNGVNENNNTFGSSSFGTGSSFGMDNNLTSDGYNHMNFTMTPEMIAQRDSMLQNMPHGSGSWGVLKAGLEGFIESPIDTENKVENLWQQMDIYNEFKNKEKEYEKNYKTVNEDNLLSANDRIKAMKNGEMLNINIADNPYAQYDMPWYTIENEGKYYVNKYGDIIEKYAQKYNVDADLVKSIMYNEAATGHKIIFNWLGDVAHVSDSQMPMNIQDETWGDFQGEYYDTWDAEQNIELAVRVIKQITDSLDDPTYDKIGTLWNSTGNNTINSVGARINTIYEQKPWEK